MTLAIPRTKKRRCARQIVAEQPLLVLDHQLQQAAGLKEVRVCMQSLAKSRVGTPGYMAPEIVANKPKEGQTYDGKPADLWSAGVILYVMLCARFPFERPDDSQLAYQDKLKKVLQRIVNVQYSFPRGMLWT